HAGDYEGPTATPIAASIDQHYSVTRSATRTASRALHAAVPTILYTAAVNNAVTGSDLIVTLSNGQTITIPVGGSSGSSAPFAVRDREGYVQGEQTDTVGISSTSGGNYEALTTGSTVTSVVHDDADVRVVTLTAASANVTEGGSIVYTATINNAATGSDLVVTLSNGQTITIPVGGSSGSSAPFTVRGDDAYVQGDQTVTVGISGTSGANYEALSTGSTATSVVHDNADSTLLNPPPISANVTEGGSIAYTATVNNAVTGSDLVVALSNGQTITIPVGASSASGAPFAVRADDAYVQADQTVTVAITNTTGGNYEALSTSSTAT